MSKRNEGYKKNAIENGRIFYNKEYIDTWPTCVVCDEKICHKGIDTKHRTCACVGVTWYCGAYGWVRNG